MHPNILGVSVFAQDFKILKLQKYTPLLDKTSGSHGDDCEARDF
jgi:hypothetical protein